MNPPRPGRGPRSAAERQSLQLRARPAELAAAFISRCLRGALILLLLAPPAAAQSGPGPSDHGRPAAGPEQPADRPRPTTERDQPASDRGRPISLPASQPASSPSGSASQPGQLTELEATAVGADRVSIEGTLLDDREQLMEALGLRGLPGISPQQGERILRFLDALGYMVRLELRGDRTVLRLTPHRVIRKIKVKGNWPLFEDEILRRLRFRPGQRLPEGKELGQTIAHQEERMKSFLSKEGYFEGSLRIKVKPERAERVNLQAEVRKGRRHRIGEVVVRHLGRSAGASQQGLSDPEIARTFKHKILWYQRSFNTDQLRTDVEALVKRYHQLGYPGVRIRESYEVLPSLPADQAVRVSLDINQRKRLKVVFRGNRKLSEKDLRPELTFAKEGAYDDYEATQSVRALHRRYQSEGYLQARVEFTRKVSEHLDEITFQIEEGPRFRVRQVSFLGNRAFTDKALGEVIRTRTFPWLGYISLGEGGYITDTQLKQDVERLQAHYQEYGFQEVRVSGEVTPHPELMGRPAALAAAVAAGQTGQGAAHVRFSIEEGRQVLVERVELSGNQLLGSQLLLGQLQLKAGRPFTEKALTLDKARLARIYAENGHPYANVPPPLEELSPDGGRVVVRFSVSEGPPARFGPIFMRGNFKTRRSVILSDLPFKPGDRFDIRKIEAADALMRQRQIFNLVRIQLLGITEEQPLLPILVTVEDRHDDWGAIEFSVGGATDNPFFGSVAYTNQNLLGFGTSLTLKGEAGLRIQSGEARYRDPRLFGTSIALDAEGFLRNQLTERLGEIFTVGASLGLSKELLPNLRGLIRYEFRHINHKEDVVHPGGIDEERQVDVPTRTGGIGPVLVYDRRDNPLTPTRGFRLGTSALFATRYLGGWDDFIKLNVNGQVHIPLPWDITISLSARYDHGFPLGKKVLLPKVERFYAGGDTTIRGLEEDHAWTERIVHAYSPLDGAALHRIRPQGGNLRLLSNLELQFPIWRESILFKWPLMGAVFLDNGVVRNSWRGLAFSDLRHGAGVALRILTPVGSSSFEYAWALDPQVGDPSNGRFHFNFGFVF